jgi:hypothetical protein
MSENGDPPAQKSGESVKRAQYAFAFTELMRKAYDTAHPHAHRNLFSNWFWGIN